MKIRHLSIRNFRGIKELDWNVTTDLICFIGAGDSTKSTILDAIECTISPKWNIAFEDSDFYKLGVDNNIEIDVTIGQLPGNFISEQKYGLFLRGWNEKDGVKDEPDDKDELVITISLKISKDLEPKWLIKNNRLIDERRIATADRASLGMTRLGTYTDRHLSWASGSILSGMTGESVKINNILAEAARKIRNEIDLDSLEDITKAVAIAEKLGKDMGVLPKGKLKAHIDLKKVSIKESVVALHDDNVPLRLSGIGTQRLMGLALQMQLAAQGGINLIDEIEYGLEPHRICQILKLLRKNVSSKGQTFLTTHSPAVLQELNVSNLKIVFSENGKTTISDFKNEDIFQRLLRTSPFAFLSKRIIVCEGKTEQGILRGLDTKWIQDDKHGMWSYGVVAIDGCGEDSFTIAEQLNSIKYQVLWWGDSDIDAHTPKKDGLKSKKIPVIDWDNKANLEDRLFNDLPWAGVKELIAIAVERHGQQSIIDQLKNIDSTITNDIDKWADSEKLRDALRKTANSKSWFKCVTYAEHVGDVVAKYLKDIKNSDLNNKIEIIRSWIETGEHSTSAATGK